MFGFGINQAHEFFIMQSDEYKNKVIKEMKKWCYCCQDEKDLIWMSLNECGGLDESDFTDMDWKEIEKAAYQIMRG